MRPIRFTMPTAPATVVGPSGQLPDLVVHRETGWACREATADELALGSEYVAAAAEGPAREAAWRQYAQALLAGNEVLFID